MPITSLSIADFRNLGAVALDPEIVGLNIICGNNGSGKTSLLEAIYYLGLGRSFRTSTATRLIRHSANKFSVFAQLNHNNDHSMPVGIERDTHGATRMRMAEKDVASVTELASLLPIRVINSQSHHLFESGPVYRRKYLDWGLFYQSEHFLSCWRQFERVLKQRNAVLRDRRPKKELDVWTEEFIKHAGEFERLRRQYVAELAPFITEIGRELLGQFDLSITYRSGWDEAANEANLWADYYAEEMRLGYTLIGPHRADFDITINGLSAKHFLSRGQQKLLICAMIVAQGKLLTKHVNKGLIYLVDDLPSELDQDSRHKLISLLATQQTQVFITAIESEIICRFISKKAMIPMKVFHVEHGSVVELNLRSNE